MTIKAETLDFGIIAVRQVKNQCCNARVLHPVCVAPGAVNNPSRKPSATTKKSGRSRIGRSILQGKLAEGMGFEPTIQFNLYNGLANRLPISRVMPNIG